MRTAPETSGAAAETAEAEAATWLGIAGAWRSADHRAVWLDVPGREASVVGLYDPREDLLGRMTAWGYPPGALDLSDLARFAAGLAQAEAEAWNEDRAHVATQAYADRRFLLGDRILHWAVPWLDMVRRWYPESADRADETSRHLLELGDRHRPAPALSGTEGLVVPGFDAYGPLDSKVALDEFLLSLWSGIVLSSRHISAITQLGLTTRTIEPQWLHSGDVLERIHAAYRAMAETWDSLAAKHPGTAQLWLDLSRRAADTAALCRA